MVDSVRYLPQFRSEQFFKRRRNVPYVRLVRVVEQGLFGVFLRHGIGHNNAVKGHRAVKPRVTVEPLNVTERVRDIREIDHLGRWVAKVKLDP